MALPTFCGLKPDCWLRQVCALAMCRFAIDSSVASTTSHGRMRIFPPTTQLSFMHVGSADVLEIVVSKGLPSVYSSGISLAFHWRVRDEPAPNEVATANNCAICARIHPSLVASSLQPSARPLRLLASCPKPCRDLSSFTVRMRVTESKVSGCSNASQQGVQRICRNPCRCYTVTADAFLPLPESIEQPAANSLPVLWRQPAGGWEESTAGWLRGPQQSQKGSLRCWRQPLNRPSWHSRPPW